MLSVCWKVRARFSSSLPPICPLSLLLLPLKKQKSIQRHLTFIYTSKSYTQALPHHALVAKVRGPKTNGKICHCLGNFVALGFAETGAASVRFAESSIRALGNGSLKLVVAELMRPNCVQWASREGPADRIAESLRLQKTKNAVVELIAAETNTSND